MAASGLEEARDILEAFVASPQREGPAWRDLIGTTDESLCARIAAALKTDVGIESALRDLLEIVSTDSFHRALETVAATAGVKGAETRQWRSAQALLLTALVAAAATRAQSEHGSELPEVAVKDLRQACLLLSAPPRVLQRGNRWQERPAVGDACDLVRRELEAQAREAASEAMLAGCAAARYWINGYWLQNPEGHSWNSLQLPTVTLHSKADHPFVGAFRAFSRPSWQVAALIEHPEISLLCLGASFLDSITRAWRSAAESTAVWRIDSHDVMAQDDESMSGAAAVVFRALAEDRKLGSGVLVLGRVHMDGYTLQAVGSVREKIVAALDDKNTRALDLTVLLGGTSKEVDDLRARVRIHPVTNLIEAMTHACATVNSSSGSQVGPYKLERRLSVSPVNFELWEVSRGKDAHLLLKLWHVDALQQLLMRASWDREMRTLYRVCSLPRAEELLLAISDSLVDGDRFALVMRPSHDERAGAPHTLERALKERPEHPFLNDIHTARGRHTIWRGLRRIAQGIQLLHSQNVVHRNLSAECVFFSGDLTHDSLRLGGFEWSARVGGSQANDKPSAWATPPIEERREITTVIDTDWYGFGMLAARCFFDLEQFANNSAHELNLRVTALLASGEHPLTERETTLLQRLVDPDRSKRLKEPGHIVAELDHVISQLGERAYSGDTAYIDTRSALYVLCNAPAWEETLMELGFDRSTNVRDANDAELKLWLKKEFQQPRIYRMPNNDRIWLGGQTWALRLLESKDGWKYAFADALEMIGIPDDATSLTLSGIPLEFLVVGEDVRNYEEKRNWQPYLPAKAERIVDANDDRETLVRFLRCTNQLDLLLCYAEIFPCTAESLGVREGMERVRLTPRVVADRTLPAWLQEADAGEMSRHFQERLDSSSVDARRVVLTTDSRIRLSDSDARRDEWLLDSRAFSDNANGGSNGATPIVLMRPVEGDRQTRPHGAMYVRARDHFGQVQLIDRRGKAIDVMSGFRYLLDALAAPHPMSTKLTQLPLEAATKPIDENKRSVLKDILSGRPIYALQGPPGTGKTTLIAHLTRQILAEDQTAQILITAQAHGAVQRLQEKLNSLRGDEEPPLMIRLGIDDDDDSDAMVLTPDSDDISQWGLRRQTVDILEKTKKKFAAAGPQSDIESAWLQSIDAMLEASRLQKLPAFSDLAAFQQLIRDGANIVFCTTSAGDLEAIATGDKTFDWSIVEEAGKVHGYDLALPMSVGHRWLLVGDQRQLKAYRFEDFTRALDSHAMEESVELLRKLRDQNPDLVDSEWLQQWTVMRSQVDPYWMPYNFLQRAQGWLRTFDHVYNELQSTTKDLKVTEEKPENSTVGRLTHQYRMHPAIGDLVAETYYWEPLPGTDSGSRVFVTNETGTIAEPDEEVLHGLVEPSIVRQTPIVWLDVPWYRNGNKAAQEKGNFSLWNDAEVELVVRFCHQLRFAQDQEPTPPLKVAVLAPYVAQKEELEKKLKAAFKNGYGNGLALKEGLFGRQRNQQKRFTHTVDSFQGNEADIVVVSLTRNNDWGMGKGLGFVADSNRMNVLLSRAQRLLVLVGSWDFFKYQVDDVNVESNPRHKRGHIKRMLTKLEELGQAMPPAFVRARWEKSSWQVQR